ncbi:MAG: ATP-binding cassette domain-containing protein, partial [Oscillospiraceae bacterium]|nr:ATP-binding cassette domain-containing protein [Oscillospiraceae bacterium]
MALKRVTTSSHHRAELKTAKLSKSRQAEVIRVTNEKKVVVDLQGIIKRFYIGQPNELQILNGMDIKVHEGEFVAIVGESGSGKSTLMNIIGALDRPTEGSYFFNGEDISKLSDKKLSNIRNKQIGFVFQNF